MLHRWGHRGIILAHLWPKLYHLLTVRVFQVRSCRAVAAAHAVPLEHLLMTQVRLRVLNALVDVLSRDWSIIFTVVLVRNTKWQVLGDISWPFRVHIH